MGKGKKTSCIDFHVDMRTEKHLNAGMTPAEADAFARTQFGDMEAAMNGMRLADNDAKSLRR